MSGFNIRPSTEADLDGIARGFASATARPFENVRHMIGHALGGNPFGCSSIVAEDSSGRIVGHLGASHVPMQIGEHEMTFGRLFGCWTDELYRVGGIHGSFVAMDETFAEYAEAGGRVHAVFGLVHESDWWFLRRVRDFKPVRTEIRAVRLPAPFQTQCDLDVRRLTSDELDRLPRRTAARSIDVRRDGALMRFRTSNPWRDDFVLGVVDRDGSVRGHAIVRPRGEVVIVMEFRVPPEDEVAAHALLGAVIGTGERRVEAPSFARSPWLLTFARAGFRVAPEDGAYLGIRAASPRVNAEALAEEWDAAAADLGRAPQPRFIHAEDIVVPPPLGTTSGRDKHV